VFELVNNIDHNLLVFNNNINKTSYIFSLMFCLV